VTTTISSQRATGREWAGLAVLALPTLLLSVDIFVLLLALPKIGEQLRASSTQQLWISDSYGFLLAGFLVTMGTLGDRIGRRRLLLIGAAAFGAASVLAAYATSPATLIGGDAERQPDPRCGSPSQGWCCGCAERDKQPAWVRSRHRHSRQRGGCRIPEPCRLGSPVSAAGPQLRACATRSPRLWPPRAPCRTRPPWRCSGRRAAHTQQACTVWR